jgi:hypothetical protein
MFQRALTVPSHPRCFTAVKKSIAAFWVVVLKTISNVSDERTASIFRRLILNIEVIRSSDTLVTVYKTMYDVTT